MGLLPSSQVDYAGSLWQHHRPALTSFEALRSGVHIGINNALTWEKFQKLRAGSQIRRSEADSPHEREVLSPQQIVEEFPAITKPQKNPLSRAEARYLQQRDMEEQALMSAFTGRNSDDLTHTISRFVGAFGGAATDPLNLALVFVPYMAATQFGLRVSALRSVLMAGKEGFKVNQARPVMMGAAAVDAAMGGAVYAGLQAASRGLYVNKLYDWENFFTEVGFAAGFGGMIGGIAPRKTALALQAFEDKRVLATFAAWQRELVNKGQTEMKKFLQDSTGALDLRGIGKILSGGSANPRKGKHIKPAQLKYISSMDKGPAQDLGKWARMHRDNTFGPYFRIRQGGVRNYGMGGRIVEFKPPKGLFRYDQRPLTVDDISHSGNSVYAHFGYAQIPRAGLTKLKSHDFVGMILRKTPEQAANDAFLFSKTPADKYHSIQVRTERTRYYNAHTVLPDTVWKGNETLIKYRQNNPGKITYDDLVNAPIIRHVNQRLANLKYDGVFFGDWERAKVSRGMPEGALKLKDIVEMRIFANKLNSVLGFSDQVHVFKPEVMPKQEQMAAVKTLMEAAEGKGVQFDSPEVRRLVHEVFIPEGSKDWSTSLTGSSAGTVQN